MYETAPFCLDTVLCNYMPLPREILNYELSSTAMLVYGALLDRATLSQKNRFCGIAGQVYVIYPIEQLAKTLGKGKTTIKRCLDELESVKLIRRERSGMNCPSHIFVSAPQACFRPVTQPKNSTWDSPKSGFVTGRKEAPNNKTERSYFIDYYQYSEGESL